MCAVEGDNNTLFPVFPKGCSHVQIKVNGRHDAVAALNFFFALKKSMADMMLSPHCSLLMKNPRKI
jgi:hypothetical protein